MPQYLVFHRYRPADPNALYYERPYPCRMGSYQAVAIVEAPNITKVVGEFGRPHDEAIWHKLDAPDYFHRPTVNADLILDMVANELWFICTNGYGKAVWTA